nr:zinc finger MYM-type protein 1-like [Parasteatoda tepidariorum]
MECQVEEKENFQNFLLFAFNQGSKAAKAVRDICADHIRNTGNKGSVNYLSSTTVTEFINIMSNSVLQEAEVKEAMKYFGLIVDSTPDISHVDQLAIVLRYADKDAEPVERFLKFVTIHGHSTQQLQKVITDFLENMQIELKYCRGQSFDNASNMSGKYSGLQARF